MMSNARKAEIYQVMLRHVQRGWTKNVLDNGRQVCLAGALNRDGSTTTGERSAIISDLAAAIKGRSVVSLEGVDEITTVFLWNDFPLRRKGQVIKLLEDRIEVLTALAREDRVRELETLVDRLRQRVTRLNELVAQLEERNAQLESESENSMFRQLRERHTAIEMREASTALTDLDDELDRRFKELTALAT